MGSVPMSDVRTRLRTAAAGLTRAIDAAESRAAWAAESPCEGWTAGDVADHITNNYLRVAGSLGAEVATTGRRSEDWGTARDAVLAAASEPGALDTVVTGPDGPTPLGRFLAVYMEVDTLVHTWDIARAVGADESLDEGLCRWDLHVQSVVECEHEPLVAAQPELDTGTHPGVTARPDPRPWAGRHDRHRGADDRERGVFWFDPPPRPSRIGGVVAVHEQLF